MRIKQFVAQPEWDKKVNLALFVQSKATGGWIYEGQVDVERHARIVEYVHRESGTNFRIIDLDAAQEVPWA
jgi:hypothetical protein